MSDLFDSSFLPISIIQCILFSFAGTISLPSVHTLISDLHVKGRHMTQSGPMTKHYTPGYRVCVRVSRWTKHRKKQTKRIFSFQFRKMLAESHWMYVSCYGEEVGFRLESIKSIHQESGDERPRDTESGPLFRPWS